MMITRSENIQRINERVARYLHVDDGDFIKVAHRACKDFDDDEMDQALAYVDEMLADHPRRKRAAQPQPVTPTPTELPEDQLTKVGGVKVRVLGRAYEHIPPKYWKQFSAWIADGSLGAEIKRADDTVTSWYQVKLVSDENLGSERIAIVASYEKGELVIYHAHPNIYGYADFVRK